MQISAAMVKELRERTGAGMMDCKKALTEANGDMEAAIEAMRKSGAASAVKKAGRIAAEGQVVIAISDDAKKAAIVEINCETDFVAKDENFENFASQLSASILATGVSDIEAISALELVGGKTVEETRQALVAKIGENIQVRRAVVVDAGDGAVASYRHGMRIGVVVVIDKAELELGRDLAMHIAASRPVCVDESGVPAELLEKEKEIFTAQALESGKPADIVEKMVVGRLKKYLAEVTLLGQPFVKDSEKAVGKLLQEHALNVSSFIRFEVGEGIEKKQEDFAAEVMAQVRGS